MAAREPRVGERGFTLIELVVLVAILCIIGGLSCETLAQRPAQARSTAAAFAGLVAEARALAAITGDGGSATGATLAVTREAGFSVATLYTYRPISGARTQPTPALDTPPLRTPTLLAIVRGNVLIEPPFALFFSAGGNVSAQAPFSVGGDAPLAAEPDCPVRSGVILAFIDGVHDQAYPLSCEMARLDLDAPVPMAAR